MNASFTVVSSFIHNPGFAALWLDALIKSFVVLAFAGGLYVTWRRAAATTRHLIWFVAIASLPLLPLLSRVLPTSQRPLWSVSGGIIAGNQISLSLEFAPARTDGGMLTQPERAQTENSASTPGSDNAKRVLTAKVGQSWLAMAVIAWAAGMAFMLAYSLLGQFQLRKISRNARRLDSPEWTRLLNEARQALRLRRSVVLLQSAESIMPLTWGWLRPRVLMPLEAEQWPAERRRIVLLHELAHVKRWDCLTQFIARTACALYWFNPLAWIAARRMCVERERACDDLVLNGGCKASDYAGHLVQIARTFRHAPQAAGIAMARSSNLEQRVTAIVDASRARRLRPMGLAGVLAAIAALILCIGGYKTSLANDTGSGTAVNQTAIFSSLQDPATVAQLKRFVAEKVAQADAATNEPAPGFAPFFAAAERGDWLAVSNDFQDFRRHAGQYEGSANVDGRLHGTRWEAVKEVWGTLDAYAHGNEKYTTLFANDIIQSIPPGSIYFGGTDPGRFLITGMQKSQVNADPFFTLTQNALADGTYLDYLRTMYGGKIYIPTQQDSQNSFEKYVQDAERRLENHQLQPGEDVTNDENGHLQVRGQVAVMAVNGLIARVVVDKNPDREFYLEESFAIDSMFPYLEPYGLIFKLNHQRLTALSDEVIHHDHDTWTNYAAGMIGNWLHDDTSVKTVADFAENAFVQKDYGADGADPQFVGNSYAHKTFSKLRSSIAGVYAWRAQHASDAGEKQRMSDAADFAFRQAFALCPYSPEGVKRYAEFLKTQERISDAQLVARTGADAAAVWDKTNSTLPQLSRQLSESQPPSHTSYSPISQLDSHRVALEAEHEQTQETLEKLKALKREELEKALPKAVTDRQLSGLLAELDTAEQHFASIKQQYTPQHPKYISAEELVTDLQRKIDDRMDGILVGLQAKLDATAAHIAAIKQVKELQISTGSADPTSR